MNGSIWWILSGQMDLLYCEKYSENISLQRRSEISFTTVFKNANAISYLED